MAEPYNRKNIEEAARALRAAGARVREWEAPETLGGPDAGAAPHHDQGGDAVLCQGTRALLPSLLADHEDRDGRGRRREPPAICRRQEAQAAQRSRQLDEAWEKFDLLLAPSARGEAPSGLGNTGDPIFNRFWTLLGTPCIALPFNTGPFGLPLSVQLIGPRGRDDQLIAWARWVERSSRDPEAGPDRLRRHRQACRGGAEVGGIENIELVSALVKRPRNQTATADPRAGPLLCPSIRRRRRMRRPRGGAGARPARAGSAARTFS